MARAKAEKAEAENESGEGVSQMDMVRAALGELGPGAKPQAVQDYILSKFNKELPKTIISNYKSNLKKKGELGGVGRGRRGGAGGSLHLEDLEAVRGLVNRLGADQVVRLVEVLA
ncbi:MAG: hypothetical protein JWO38_363 [Gemmataceae bacterium]|nr:hypothetical protein [Gemmataceae bacterium]